MNGNSYDQVRNIYDGFAFFSSLQLKDGAVRKEPCEQTLVGLNVVSENIQKLQVCYTDV